MIDYLFKNKLFNNVIDLYIELETQKNFNPFVKMLKEK